MSKDKETVDLVANEDGSYGVKADKPKIEKRQIKRAKKLECDMSNMEQLLFGMDMGIEFMEKLLPRVKSIQNLKNLVR